MCSFNQTSENFVLMLQTDKIVFLGSVISIKQRKSFTAILLRFQCKIEFHSKVTHESKQIPDKQIKLYL